MMNTTATKTVFTKCDIRNKVDEVVFACQRLYNIRERGLWNDVVEAGYELVDKLDIDSKFSEAEMNEMLKPVISNMYAIAGYDD